jgi:hypothetical protein
MTDEPEDTNQDNARGLAKLSEMPAVLNNIHCPRISPPTGIYSERRPRRFRWTILDGPTR